MENILQKGLRFYADNHEILSKDFLDCYYVILEQRVVYYSKTYTLAFMWVFEESYQNGLDFMDYLIINGYTDNYCDGVYHLLWCDDENRCETS